MPGTLGGEFFCRKDLAAKPANWRKVLLSAVQRGLPLATGSFASSEQRFGGKVRKYSGFSTDAALVKKKVIRTAITASATTAPPLLNSKNKGKRDRFKSKATPEEQTKLTPNRGSTTGRARPSAPRVRPWGTRGNY